MSSFSLVFWGVIKYPYLSENGKKWTLFLNYLILNCHCLFFYRQDMDMLIYDVQNQVPWDTIFLWKSIVSHQNVPHKWLQALLPGFSMSAYVFLIYFKMPIHWVYVQNPNICPSSTLFVCPTVCPPMSVTHPLPVCPSQLFIPLFIVSTFFTISWFRPPLLRK